MKSSPRNSFSFSRGNAAVGGPFSTTAPVGVSVDGSIGSTHTPSNGTARARIRAASLETAAHGGAKMQEPHWVVAQALG